MSLIVPYKPVFCIQRIIFRKTTTIKTNTYNRFYLQSLIGRSTFNLVHLCFIYYHHLRWTVIYSSFNLNNIRQKSTAFICYSLIKLTELSPCLQKLSLSYLCDSVPVFQNMNLKSLWSISKLDIGPKYERSEWKFSIILVSVKLWTMCFWNYVTKRKL